MNTLGYDWTTDAQGRVIAMAPSDHTRALAHANKYPSERDAFARGVRLHHHAFAALYLLTGLALGCLLMLALTHIARPG